MDLIDHYESAKCTIEKDYLTGWSASKVSDYLLGLDASVGSYYDEEDELDEDLAQYYIKDGRVPVFMDNFDNSDLTTSRDGQTVLRTSASSLRRSNYIHSSSSGVLLEDTIEALRQSLGEFSDDDVEVVVTPKQSTCLICLEALAECKDVVQVKGCGHQACRECISNYIDFKSKDASVLYHRLSLITREAPQMIRVDDVNAYGINCPGSNCSHVMLINELVPMSDMESISRFLRMSNVHTEELRAQQNVQIEPPAVIRCTNCHGPNVYRIRFGRLRCAGCHAVMCPDCMERHPRYEECGWVRPSNVVGVLEQHRMIRCPGCKNAIERTEGCNHMACRCGTHFCWVCGVQLESDFYTHVNSCKRGLTKGAEVNKLLFKRFW